MTPPTFLSIANALNIFLLGSISGIQCCCFLLTDAWTFGSPQLFVWDCPPQTLKQRILRPDFSGRWVWWPNLPRWWRVLRNRGECRSEALKRRERRRRSRERGGRRRHLTERGEKWISQFYNDQTSSAIKCKKVLTEQFVDGVFIPVNERSDDVHHSKDD